MTRVLLDEGVPRPLDTVLRTLGIDARPFPNRWKQLSNGGLLVRIQGAFDILITCDKNMEFQQNLDGKTFSVLILPTNTRDDVLALAPAIAAVLPELKPGRFARMSTGGSVAMPGRDG
jgi:hypothetical protein